MDPLAVAWAACGQEQVLATPLQMALVAAAVANGGPVMRPYVVQEVRTADGSVVEEAAPAEWLTAIKPATALSLNEMMQRVVTSGTGTGAAIEGVDGGRQDRHGGDAATAPTSPGSSASRRPTTRASPSPWSSRTPCRRAAPRRRRWPPRSCAPRSPRRRCRERGRERGAGVVRDSRQRRQGAATVTDAFQPDQIVNERYRVLRKLGAGGMADVYLCEDLTLGRQVALKVLSSRFVGDAQFVERFRREAKAAAGLNHPNIVAIYDWGEIDGTYFIVMEYVEGETSRSSCAARPPHRQRGARHRARAARRRRLRPPPRRRPPRHQAAEHPPRRRGHGQGHRLRHRPRRRRRHDRGGLDPRHGPVPLARAGARRDRSTSARTCTRSASSSTRCSPAGSRSRATAPSRWR